VEGSDIRVLAKAPGFRRDQTRMQKFRIPKGSEALKPLENKGTQKAVCHLSMTLVYIKVKTSTSVFQSAFL
jgi:hypothetical protein